MWILILFRSSKTIYPLPLQYSKQWSHLYILFISIYCIVMDLSFDSHREREREIWCSSLLHCSSSAPWSDHCKCESCICKENLWLSQRCHTHMKRSPLCRGGTCTGNITAHTTVRQSDNLDNHVPTKAPAPASHLLQNLSDVCQVWKRFILLIFFSKFNYNYVWEREREREEEGRPTVHTRGSFSQR